MNAEEEAMLKSTLLDLAKRIATIEKCLDKLSDVILELQKYNPPGKDVKQAGLV